MDEVNRSSPNGLLTEALAPRWCVNIADRHRPWTNPATFVAPDALTMNVREGGRVINAVVMIATGLNAAGGASGTRTRDPGIMSPLL